MGTRIAEEAAHDSQAEADREEEEAERDATSTRADPGDENTEGD
jgi:hypothetical protein